jgi:hypothetical protein
MDVGQDVGDLLISPDGHVVLFDAGEALKKKDCARPASHLDQLGIKSIDYVFASPYHFRSHRMHPRCLQTASFDAEGIWQKAGLIRVRHTRATKRLSGQFA